jgi:hypothetical protein
MKIQMLCLECRWWVDASIGDNTGGCHRHSPKHIFEEIEDRTDCGGSAIWPETHKLDFCGDYEVRKNPDKPT